jgi:hypothetical protein
MTLRVPTRTARVAATAVAAVVDVDVTVDAVAEAASAKMANQKFLTMTS